MESCPPLRAHALLACWLGGASLPLSLSLSLSFSFHSSCFCLSDPSPSNLSNPCLHRCSVRRGREREYKTLRCEQGNCLLGRFYSLKRAHRPPSPRPLHPSAPLSLSLPRRFCSSIGQLFSPSTSV